MPIIRQFGRINSMALDYIGSAEGGIASEAKLCLSRSGIRCSLVFSPGIVFPYVHSDSPDPVEWFGACRFSEGILGFEIFSTSHTVKCEPQRAAGAVMELTFKDGCPPPYAEEGSPYQWGGK
jgi:hypothetical protein